MRILMVCLGNICRSPMAEGIMKALVQKNGLNWEIASAGTESYHIGAAPHQLSQKTCHAHQIDISQQQARRFQAKDILYYDLIYAMSVNVLEEIKYLSAASFDGSKIKLLLDEVYPGQNRSVPDPWNLPEEAYITAFDLIYGACEQIVDKYRHLPHP